ncbi:outer membrane biogenesis protein BamB [Phycisphaerae bacterium RAS1]|nr:outer membrane biogenesis protein BamB [Phycisphaerae bacterium RAS1]
MRRALSTAFGLALVAPAAPLHADDNAAGRPHWPQFRGPQARGVCESCKTPATWNIETGENIAWKSPLPGLGLSSPIVWGDRVFVTTAVKPEDAASKLKVGLYGDIQPINEPIEHSYRVICLDRNTGRVLWDKEAARGVPKIKRHPKASHANSTPVTDGRHVVAMFGAEGLYCFDMSGELKWKKDFGPIDSGFFMVKSAQWGFGSSPVIHDGRLLLQCDVQEGSFLAAYDINDGRELWKTPRADVPTWSSPTVLVGKDRTQVICNGWKHIGGYDLGDGSEIWKMTGGGDIPVPTPILAGGLIFITSAHGSMAPIYAIRPGATGDITPKGQDEKGEHIAWWKERRGNYMQTPLCYGDLLYFCMDNGMLSVYGLEKGEQIYRERIGEGNTGFTASIVAADDKLYVSAEVGEVFVVKTGVEYDLLGKNTFGESIMATPAISENMILFRTEKQLVAVRGKS